MAIGLKRRNDPAVLAATRSESGSPAKGELMFLSAFVTFALLLGAGPSSPSVPSSYPEVFPPAAVAAFGLRALGLLTEALEEGRDEALGFPPAVVLPLSSLP
jgi:hypothetical protein